ncbi:MAG: DinB family protein [Planctomycetota bacterium]
MDLTKITEGVRSALKSQYHSALAMMKESIERCPEDLWYNNKPVNTFWQIAYHALFFAHCYSQKDEASFHPWEQHQAKVQYPDGIAGPPEPNNPLPLLPKPYTKAQILAYWSFCDQMIDHAVDEMDVHSAESGFSWYKVSKLEHQLVNIRHIQHHTAQLADRLRTALDIGINWVGAKRSSKTT